jgi:purine nucleoside phosphorylase
MPAAMAIGIITGSGTYALPGFEGEPEEIATEWGTAVVARGRFAGVDVLHVSRHGAGHVRLSNHVTHRANIGVLRELGAVGAVAVTVCGAIDPSVELGSLICFDDLHFVANRLADGSLCTFYDRPGDPRRGHWIYEDPYSPALREALLAGAAAVDVPVRDGGCYGHVDGPRFNTRAEIRGLAAAGVTAVSQTAGPETVLAGEAELPFALLGYATDYANGVRPQSTPLARLLELIAASTATFAHVLEAALPQVHAAALAPAGAVHRFHGG